MELINLFIEDSLEDKSGVSGIALVDSPAIQEGWLAFKKHPKKYTIQCGTHKGNFAAVEGDQQVLAGPLMIPNKNIYRIDEQTGQEFEVVFSPETIKKIQEKFSQLNLNKAINQMHDNTSPVNAFITQQFIIDSKSGINAPFNQDLPDGTWYGYIKVNDKQLWDNFIKSGIYTGFSVEGVFYEEVIKTDLSAEDKALLDFLLQN